MPLNTHKKKFSLQFHIFTLLTILIVSSCGVISWYSYKQLSENIINSGKVMFDNSAQEIIKNMRRESNNIQKALTVLAASGLTERNDSEAKIAAVPLSSAILKGMPGLYSLFVAHDNNDIFIFKKISSQVTVKGHRVPKNSHFMMTLRQSNKTIHYFYDINSQLLKSIEDTDYNLIVKDRPWYKLAQQKEGFIYTDPYLFHGNNELGLSFLKSDKIHGAVIGVDYTLDAISDGLQQLQNYGHRIIVDDKGNVIASQNGKLLRSDLGKVDKLKKISDLNQPILEYVFNRYKNEEDNILFSYNNESWLLKRTRFIDNDNFFLFQLVKTKELLSEAYELRYKSALITIAFILAMFPVAWYFSRRLTTPISGLTKELEKIKNLNFKHQIKTKTSIKEVDELINITNNMKETVSQFQDLSASLASKQSFQQLLNKISRECNNIPNSQGTVIILNEDNIVDFTHCNLTELSLSENEQLTQKLSALSISYADLEKHNSHQEAIPDSIYQLINEALPAMRTINWHLLAMENRSGKNLGFIALIDSQQAPLSIGKLKYAQAIASFSALSIQNQQLLAEQKNLLESFILIIAGAIDSKSPYTGSHCARVPELTKMLSQAACDDKQGNYKNFDLDEEQWEELHIAAWLHDCGKIVTPINIIDKATKLEVIYDRLNEVRMRFELLKQEVQTNYWQALCGNGDEAQLKKQRDELLEQLDQEFEFVAACNIGSEFMSDEKILRLQQISKRTWTRTLNNKIGIAPHQSQKIVDCDLPIQESLLANKAEHLIEREHNELTAEGNKWGFTMKAPKYQHNRGELYNLSTKKGTLTAEDRYIINGHMVDTIVMLSQLPFPEHLKNIPLIAGSHHEKMDGTGYPCSIKAGELPLTARIMVVADIFEALTASDRPYKERKTLSEALKIMSFMVKDNHIDPDVFTLFLTSGVYLQYAQEYLLAEQIDDVDINQYL